MPLLSENDGRTEAGSRDCMSSHRLSVPQRSVAVFSARESAPALLVTLDAILSACREPTVVDVLVNGNSSLVEEFTTLLRQRSSDSDAAIARIWFVALGDKANAWNQYLRHVWQAGTGFFVDGYARPAPESFRLLEEGLNSSTHILAATGLPSSGRTAASLSRVLQQTHGLHGNLYCVNSRVMLHMKSSGFHLPLGIYRTDPVLEAAVKFNFDPEHNDWDIHRVLVHPLATWTTPAKYWWRYSDVRAKVKRSLRQAQGELENRAVRFHLEICKRLPETLPATALELVENWLAECPDEARLVLRSPLWRYALAQLRVQKDWSGAYIAPALVWQSGKE